MSESQDRVAEIFAEALERTGAERDKFIDEACGGDKGLHQRVLTLIAALPEAELLFDSPDLRDEMKNAAKIVLEKAKGRSGQILGHYRRSYEESARNWRESEMPCYVKDYEVLWGEANDRIRF